MKKSMVLLGLCGLSTGLGAGCLAAPDEGAAASLDGKGDEPYGPWLIPDGPVGEAPQDRGEELDAELAEFEQMAAEIQTVMASAARFHHPGEMKRGFHAKSQGCVRAALTVLDTPLTFPAREPASWVAPYTRHGIFATVASYPAWVRFSNGVGFSQADRLPDVRGMALKVMGVTGTPLGGETQPSDVQDFLMTNGPTQLSHDARGFMDFALASAGYEHGPDGTLVDACADPLINHTTCVQASQARFLLHNEVTRHFVERLATRAIWATAVQSMLAEQFWGIGAARLGPRDVKYSLAPCGAVDTSFLPQFGDDYLSEDLAAQLAEGPGCFDMLVQFQGLPGSQYEQTPTEDPAVEWMTPFFVIGRVELLQRPDDEEWQVAQNEADTATCDTLSFSPWNALEEHRPLGNINRARRAVYDASRRCRQGNCDRLPGAPTP